MNGSVEMGLVVDEYVMSFQAEPFHQETRYHWMICRAKNPDMLVSWGHATTQQLAEEEAQNELKDLSLGVTQGGRVTSKSAPQVKS
jgi:hypothetical protein